jgi:hypothetical protein
VQKRQASRADADRPKKNSDKGEGAPMRLRFSGIVLIVGVIFASFTLRASPVQDHPGVCSDDSKLIGQVSVFGDENEASWWRLIFNGMIEAGLTTEDQQRDYLNGVFGTSFTTLDEVRFFNLQGVSSFDKNHNGFVCAYDLRGTRAYNDDPYFNFTWFGVSDDKIRK